MTDYLEERLENAGVLLEQVKRLEGSGFAPESGQREEDRAGPPLERGESPPSGGGGEADFGAEEAVDGLKRKVNRLKNRLTTRPPPRFPRAKRRRRP